jgi:hypothetical protein
MIARGQGRKAQTARLAQGCCPIHGIFMYQNAGLSKEEAQTFGFRGLEGSVSLVRCTRKKCQTYALSGRPGEIVRVLTPTECVIAEALATKQMNKFHTFVDLVRAELKTKKKKDLAPNEWEKCWQLSRREPS